MMSRFPLRSFLAVLTVLGLSDTARAEFVSTIAGLVLNNTIPDTDLDLLAQFVGLSPGPPLKYDSTITTTGFSTTLSGTYAGRSLNVTYTGDLSAFPSGAATWTSNGTYGADTWTGSGSATFSFPTATTFQVNYSSTLTMGSNAGDDNLIIVGNDADPSITYTGTTGTISVNGVATSAPTNFSGLSVPNRPKKGDLDDDNIFRNGHQELFSTTIITDVNPGPPDPPQLIVDSGVIGAFPEPSTIVLFGTGALGLFGCAWYGRRIGTIRPIRETADCQ